MSWFSGSNPMDELVERATDSSLPADSEDLALNLEICDQIRSKTVNSKDAMRSLKKRISNKNPNIQLLALNLTDLCIKNGGSHFLVEIASREFVDNLVSMLKAPLGINHDVRDRLLNLIQAWALAFEPRSELGYMMVTYQALRNEGLQFPPEERVAAAFVDSAAPPDWTDSDVCMRCRTAFTFRNRKHHCRNCGNVFCGACSTQTMTLPHLGINEPVRVCNGCYAKRAQAANATKPHSQLKHKSVPSYQQTAQQFNASQTREAEDLDLKRALEMSLAETERVAPSQNRALEVSAPGKPNTENDVEEDDADLKAAIEASLRESEANRLENPYAYPSLTGISSSSSAYMQSSSDFSQTTKETEPVAQTSQTHNTHELSIVEQENIKLFASLVDRLKMDQGGSILQDSQVQELYDTIANLRPKLARALGDTVGKYESLVETHSKLATVIKYYDGMLEARLANTYGSTDGAPMVGHYSQHDTSQPQPYEDAIQTRTRTFKPAMNPNGTYQFGKGSVQVVSPDYARHDYMMRYDTAAPPLEIAARNLTAQMPRGTSVPHGQWAHQPSEPAMTEQEPEQAPPAQEVSLIDL